MKVVIALTVAVMAVVAAGCGSACEDLRGCCQALGVPRCDDLYDNMDEDACEAAKDAIEPSSDDPAACQF
ncbi:MAG: hypothetical protein WKG00_39945 [Polyangiaceae bacterium]